MVLEWIKQPISPKEERYSSDWDTLIDKYTPIYAGELSTSFTRISINPFPLSKETSREVQTIVLDHETQKMSLNITMDHIMESPKSLWEDFVLRNNGADSWIRLEGQYRTNLKAWKIIGNMLSDDEMYNLEKWGNQHKEMFPDLITLPNL